MTTPMTTASDTNGTQSRPGLAELDGIHQCTQEELDPCAIARLVANVLTELGPSALPVVQDAQTENIFDIPGDRLAP